MRQDVTFSAPLLALRIALLLIQVRMLKAYDGLIAQERPQTAQFVLAATDKSEGIGAKPKTLKYLSPHYRGGDIAINGKGNAGKPPGLLIAIPPFFLHNSL